MFTSYFAALNLSITVALSPVASDGIVAGVARLMKSESAAGSDTVILPVSAMPVLVSTIGYVRTLPLVTVVLMLFVDTTRFGVCLRV